jgi:hypothetical protein
MTNASHVSFVVYAHSLYLQKHVEVVKLMLVASMLTMVKLMSIASRLIIKHASLIH